MFLFKNSSIDSLITKFLSKVGSEFNLLLIELDKVSIFWSILNIVSNILDINSPEFLYVEKILPTSIPDPSWFIELKKFLIIFWVFISDKSVFLYSNI